MLLRRNCGRVAIFYANTIATRSAVLKFLRNAETNGNYDRVLALLAGH